MIDKDTIKEKLNSTKAFVFDFDGVILRSVDVKTKAFVQLYADHPQQIQDEVREYHELHGGVSRYEKIKYYERQLLKRDLSQERLDKLGQKFSDLVYHGVVNSVFLPGVQDFLKNIPSDKQAFICTGTPETEIKKIVKEKGLSPYFDALYGSPKTKTEIIELICQKHGFTPEELLFFGDATTDEKAAKETGCEFIGLYAEDGTTKIAKDNYLIHDFNELPKHD